MVFEPAFVPALLVLLCSTFIRSAFGFGDALLAMPLLALILGFKTGTPLIALIALTIAVSILARDWRRVDFGSAWRLIVSSIAGIPVGLYFLRGSYETPMRIVLGVVIAGFALFHLMRPALMHLKDERLAPVFGFVAGVLGGAYNTNGPPVVIYGSLRRWPPESFRATLQGYFLLTNIFIVIGHASAGLWTGRVGSLFLLSLPLVFLGIRLGGVFQRRIPRGRFDRMIHGLLLLIGLYLLGQSVIG